MVGLSLLRMYACCLIYRPIVSGGGPSIMSNNNITGYLLMYRIGECHMYSFGLWK